MLWFPHTFQSKRGFCKLPCELAGECVCKSPLLLHHLNLPADLDQFYSCSITGKKKNLWRGQAAGQKRDIQETSPESALSTGKAKLTSYWTPVNPGERELERERKPSWSPGPGESFNQSWQWTTRQSHWKPSSITSIAHRTTCLKYLLSEDLSNSIKEMALRGR